MIAGERALAAAHRELLGEAVGRPVAAAVHALACGNLAELPAIVPEAVRALRDAGNVVRAFDLLNEARTLLGAATPPEWIVTLASLALEDGAPSRVLSLLGREGPSLSDTWRTLLHAHIEYRAGRRHEAIRLARAALERGDDPRATRTAQLIVIRSQKLLGQTEAAEAGARRLMETAPAGASLIETLRPAALLLSILSVRGDADDRSRPIRELCASGLGRLDVRERHEVAAALGAEAFQRGDFAAAGSFFEVAVEAAASGHDPTNLVISQMNLAGVWFEEGRTAECEDLNAEALRTSVTLGMETQAAHAQRNLATVMLLTCRLGDALDLCRRARGVLGENPTSPHALATLAVESEILLEAGLLESARETLESACSILSSHPAPVIATVVMRDRARLERWSGHSPMARRCLLDALLLAREAGARDDEARAAIDLAGLEVAAGNLAEASRRVEEADPIVQSSTSVELSVRYDFVRACCRRSSDPEDAIGHLAEAARRSARSHLAGWLWRCHAAASGLARSLGDGESALRSIHAARRGLLDLLDGIGPEAMRESYVMLPDARLFLAWCDGESLPSDELPAGSSDLEVFLR